MRGWISSPSEMDVLSFLHKRSNASRCKNCLLHTFSYRSQTLGGNIAGAVHLPLHPAHSCHLQRNRFDVLRIIDCHHHPFSIHISIGRTHHAPRVIISLLHLLSSCISSWNVVALGTRTDKAGIVAQRPEEFGIDCPTGLPAIPTVDAEQSVAIVATSSTPQLPSGILSPSSRASFSCLFSYLIFCYSIKLMHVSKFFLKSCTFPRDFLLSFTTFIKVVSAAKIMQMSAMKTYFQIAECSLSYTKIRLLAKFSKYFRINISKSVKC